MQISPTVKDPKRTNLFWWCQSREPNTDRCAQCWLLHLLRIFFFFFLNSKLFTFLINEARRSCEHRRRMQINFFEKIVEFRLKNYRKIGQIFWEQIRWKCKRIDVNRNRIKGNDRAICQRATGESRNERARALVLSAYRRPFFIGRRIKNRPTPNDTTLLLLLRLLLPLSASLCWLSFWKMRRQSVADANYSRLFFFFHSLTTLCAIAGSPEFPLVQSPFHVPSGHIFNFMSAVIAL